MALITIPFARRRLLTASVCGAALLLAGLLAPTRGLAGESAWTPSAASLVATARACPSPSVAAYFQTTCWSVSLDTGSPFYSPDDPYPWAQCTYWALEMRPDLWNNRSDSDPDSEDWTAHTWADHARLEGLTVDHAPAAGAVIVWPQSAGNDTGHVAYVQSVAPDPATGDVLVTVQEMNDTTFDDPSQGQGDTMTMSMSADDLAQVQVIHAPDSTGGTVPTAPSGATTSTSSTPTAPTPVRTTRPRPSTTSPVRATTASTPRGPGTRRRHPRLSVRLGAHGLRVWSRSPAALTVTVVGLPSGRLLRHRSRLHPGSSLSLPAGRFRLCISQAPVRGYSHGRACLTAGRAA